MKQQQDQKRTRLDAQQQQQQRYKGYSQQFTYKPKPAGAYANKPLPADERYLTVAASDLCEKVPSRHIQRVINDSGASPSMKGFYSQLANWYPQVRQKGNERLLRLYGDPKKVDPWEKSQDEYMNQLVLLHAGQRGADDLKRIEQLIRSNRS